MSRKSQQNQITNISEQVKALCSELFRNTPISTFYYYRISRARQFTTIGTCAQAHDFYVNNAHFTKQFQHRDYDKNIPNGVFFFESVYNSPQEMELHKIYRDTFDITNLIGIPRKNEDYCDVYAFATSTAVQNAQNFYLNNIDLLEKFVDVFREPLNKIILTNSPKILIPDTKIQIAESQEAEIQIGSDFNDGKIVQFPNVVSQALASARSSDEKIKINNNLLLTKRELIYLRYLSSGLTSKEIARTLSLSYRTVDNYCARLKEKLGCRRKQELVAMFSGIFHQ